MPYRRGSQSNIYTYKPGDNPANIANQYGITTQQLIDANPGGYPFSTGQAVNIPQTFQSQFQNFFGNAPSYLNSHGSFGQNANTVLPQLPAYLKPRGAYGQTISSTGYNNPVIGANGKPIGPHGTFGQSPNLTSPNILEQMAGVSDITSYPATGYNPAMRGRGYTPKFDATNYSTIFQNEIRQALTATDKPQSLLASSVFALGIDPRANGYAWDGSMWQLNPELAAQQQAQVNNAGGSNNDQPFDPQKYMVRNKQYAHNQRNRYWTTLAQKQNAYKRAKHGGGGGKQQQPTDTTMTGFGLVNFNAASG